MTDFLTNLAARTIAPPSLRPRTRMRFEPVAEEDAPAQPDTLPVPSPRVNGERVAEGRVRGNVAAEPQPVSPSPASPRTITREVTAPGEVITETHDVPVTNTVIVPRERIVTITKEKRIVVPQDHTRVVRETNMADAPPTPPARVDLEHREEQRARGIEREAQETGAAAGTPPHQPAGTPAFRERERTRHTVSTRTIDRTERTRETLSRVHERELRGEPEAKAEPTIHVSIGRVEVRAVAPPAAPPKTSSQHKPMSIDDYVAQREKKARR